MMTKVFRSLLLGGCLTLTACAAVPQYENAAGSVADLRLMPQSLADMAERYAGPGGSYGPGALLRPHAEAQADMERFRERFFAPWTSTEVNLFAVQDSLAELERAPDRRGYAGNLNPWTDEAWRALRRNADLPGLERVMRRPQPRAAVTVRATDLRAAPTVEPRFDEVHGAGKGWPFDLFQQSALPVGLPLSVLHESADRAWLYVESSGIWGWVRAQDVAFAEPEFQKLWRGPQLCAAVRDGVSLTFRHLGTKAETTAPRIEPGAFLASADIGTVLPASGADAVLVPVRGLDGKAYAVTAGWAPPAGGTHGAAVVSMPLPLTPAKLADVGDRMMGQPYGWGGLNGGRDCSAMMRDLFTPFGIWLPRNSAKQAEAGTRVPLDTLEPAAKEQRLLKEALPFRTLVWMPGHIGLYVGQWQGRAAFFHNMWGVRNTLGDGRPGRVIVGRAVLSGLRPGAERHDVKPENLLIERVGAFTLVGGKYSGK